MCVYVCVCVCVECHYSLSRCHAYNPSSSGCGRQPLLSSSSSTLSPSPPSSAKRPGSANPTHQTSSLPREEVLLVWAELERARDTLAEVQALRLETQEATGGGAHSDHDSSEEYLTSVQWLKVWRHLSEHSLFHGFALSLTTSFPASSLPSFPASSLPSFPASSLPSFPAFSLPSFPASSLPPGFLTDTWCTCPQANVQGPCLFTGVQALQWHHPSPPHENQGFGRNGTEGNMSQ